MNRLIIKLCIENIALLGGLIFLTSKIIRNKPLIKNESKQFDLFCKIAGELILLVVLMISLIPTIRDIPYIVENKLYYISGTTVNSSADSYIIRGVTVKDDASEETINISFYFSGTIEANDEIKAYYLPNTKLAIILSHKKHLSEIRD